MSSARILVVDDDENLRWVLKTQLEDMGYTTSTAMNGEEALAAIEKEPPALILTDLKMPGVSGMELLDRVRSDYPEVPVVMITAFATVQSAVQAMRAGAYDYLTKPIDFDELALVVTRVLEHFRLLAEVRSLRASLDRPLRGSPFSARYRGAGGAERFDDSDSRGNRHRQRAAGTGDSLQQPAAR